MRGEEALTCLAAVDFDGILVGVVGVVEWAGGVPFRVGRCVAVGAVVLPLWVRPKWATDVVVRVRV